MENRVKKFDEFVNENIFDKRQIDIAKKNIKDE